MRLLAGGAALAAVFAVQAPVASAETTTCGGGQTISGKTIPGDVVVPQRGDGAGTLCFLVNDKIGGNVTVSRNSALAVGTGPNSTPATTDATTIGGNLIGDGGSFVSLASGVTVVGDATLQGLVDIGCEHFRGNLTIKNQNRTGPATRIAPPGPVPCNGVGGNLSLLNNMGDAQLSGYAIHGDLIISGNSGTVNVAGNRVSGNGSVTNNTSQVTLNGNSFGGNLNCFNNTPPPTGSGNTAQGSLNGQCAYLG